ncbi:hypothetical protein K438DRAFT_1943920 [Mycena galopus ATCC 62051]|nr:hypothetical protein K438DRAFT_1943920 [Mycena galopus ATCC 62051]
MKQASISNGGGGDAQRELWRMRSRNSDGHIHDDCASSIAQLILHHEVISSIVETGENGKSVSIASVSRTWVRLLAFSCLLCQAVLSTTLAQDGSPDVLTSRQPPVMPLASR